MFKDSFTPEIKEELTNSFAKAIAYSKNFTEGNIVKIFYSKCAELFPDEPSFRDSSITSSEVDSAIAVSMYRGKKKSKSIKAISQDITEALVNAVDKNSEIINRINQTIKA